TLERIRSVAAHVLDTQAQGHQVAVVVSAMAGETNRLVGLAHELHPIPDSREYDLLIASGEQISVGLVTLAIHAEAERRGLIKRGEIRAVGLLGHQIGIRTDSVFSKARIQAIDSTLLEGALNLGRIPVIAGFQGVDPENNITTLGRGGSDTSAVAIAIALKADDCEIYTDVDGIYTTDPRITPKARKIEKISFEEMMELASGGAKVLQIRSVELAAKYRMPLHVRSSFSPVEGTRVVHQELLGKAMEQVVVAGVAADANQVKFTLNGLRSESRLLARIFGALSDAAVVVDVIVQDIEKSGDMSLSFTVGQTDHLKTREILAQMKSTTLPSIEVEERSPLAKVSIVGVGMQHHPGVASKMFGILSEAKIGIELITTSEIKISCLIENARMKDAVVSLHTGFGLDRTE
ncbi:MAG: aspartate kinase, partial [Proteobacteria bacterium]